MVFEVGLSESVLVIAQDIKYPILVHFTSYVTESCCVIENARAKQDLEAAADIRPRLCKVAILQETICIAFSWLVAEHSMRQWFILTML